MQPHSDQPGGSTLSGHLAPGWRAVTAGESLDRGQKIRIWFKGPSGYLEGVFLNQMSDGSMVIDAGNEVRKIGPDDLYGVEVLAS